MSVGPATGGPGVAFNVGRLRYDISPKTTRRTTVAISDLRSSFGPIADYAHLVPESAVQRLGDDSAVYPDGAQLAVVDADGNITEFGSYVSRVRVLELYDEADTGQFAANLARVYVVTASGSFTAGDIVLVRADALHWIDDEYALVRTNTFNADAYYLTEPVWTGL